MTMSVLRSKPHVKIVGFSTLSIFDIRIPSDLLPKRSGFKDRVASGLLIFVSGSRSGQGIASASESMFRALSQ